jgi:hypothetical protein
MHHAMMAQEGTEINMHTFLTLALDGGQLHAPPFYTPATPKNGLRYPLDKRLGGPTAGLDAMTKRKIPALLRILPLLSPSSVLTQNFTIQ